MTAPEWIRLDELSRIHRMRGPQLMWFLGAGASAAAGVPTAENMTWEFKQVLYSTKQGVPITSLDLSEDAIRDRLNEYFARNPDFPKPGDPREYGALFEAAWKSPQDRRQYIDQQIARGKPAYGNLGLAALWRVGNAPAVWTTNFDRVMEDAATAILQPPMILTISTTDSSQIAMQALKQSRWPLYVKLHGDYQSDSLKNVSTELREQDTRLRQALEQATQRMGMIVVGYSGRDDSVISALHAAVETSSPYPFGLFWCCRSDSPPSNAVRELMQACASTGVEARFVAVETMDELLGRLLLPLDLPPDVSQLLAAALPAQPRLPFITPQRGRARPILRFNAVEVTKFPTTVRKVVCGISGTKEVREALATAGANALAVRRRDAVIGFGEARGLRDALEPYGITDWTVGAVDMSSLFKENSTDLGLLYEALVTALARSGSLQARRLRGEHFLVVKDSGSGQGLAELKKATTTVAAQWPTPGGSEVAGEVSRVGKWSESIHLRLEYRFDRLWLIFEPTVWVERTANPIDEAVRKSRQEFIRQRLEHRYNRNAFEFLTAWTGLLTEEKNLVSFGLAEGTGIDAGFALSDRNALSFHRFS